MASGSSNKRPITDDHNFNYEYAKVAFYQEVDYVLIEKKLQTRVLMNKNDIENVISDIKLNKLHYKKYFTEKCQVVNENGKDILSQVTMKLSDSKQFYIVNIKQILCLSDLFDVLSELHMQKPHLDEIEILDHFTNCLLLNAFINLFWKSCESCSSVMKNLDMYFRFIGEMTIFTLDSPDGQFTDIFMYIERNTNFVLLRPMKSLENKEIACELLMILADFGSPTFLDSNIFRSSFKERQYNNILYILKSLEPPFRIPTMFANSRNHKINLMTNKATKMLKEWMKKTGSSNWAIGTHIVQWFMNTSKVVDTYIRSRVVNGPIHSPYHAMFGLLPHTDIIEIKDKRQSDIPTNNNKVLVECSQCKLPIYKVFKCYFCQRLCHFSCCVRYVEHAVMINKCVSCTNIDMCDDEEVILGT